MSRVVPFVLALAAALFIAVSATMNALFLSSLGRTQLEIGLLATVSIASDLSKSVLPVLMARAVLLRAWVNVAAAALMLVGVTTLSLASGTGFAALIRDAVAATRGAHAEQIAGYRQELREIEARLAALLTARAAAIVDVELAALRVDRRWQQSKSCAEPNSAAARQFCGEVFRLQAELAASREREKWTATRQTIRRALEAIQTGNAGGEDDPQATVLSGLFGVSPKLARVVLTSWMAIILELGSVIMVLLAAGPAVRGWREPGKIEPPPLVPAEVPVQADRHYWRRQRSGMGLGATTERIEGDVGGR